MDMGVPAVAGTVATVIFAVGTLPMVIKAARTKDLRSYSRSNILLSNLGNTIHSVYVFSLPAGPIWALHTFYLTTTALMLVWYLRYARAHGPGYARRAMSLRGANVVGPPEADHVVVASGTFRPPVVPDFAGELHPAIRRVQSSDDGRPVQVRGIVTSMLIAGVGEAEYRPNGQAVV
jgi:uncharacterized protein with PQ loop repeat